MYTKWISSKTPENITFTAGGQKYTLSFGRMKQRNIQYGTQRNVRRRPVTHAGVDKTIKTIVSRIPASHKSPYPLHWPASKDVSMIVTSKETEQKIRTMFSSSFANKSENKIVSVVEVCNKRLYDKYTAKKKAMQESSHQLNEKQLWHGTAHNIIKKICHQNFDDRLCETGLYGSGCYFAKNASYSNSYVKPDENNIGLMFLADVLVGDFTKGDKSMKRPPEKTTDGYELYDSCVDDVLNPTIYALFDRDQCYPRYLLRYKK